MTACTVCGLPIETGQYPCIYTVRPHGKALPSKGYEPHFDIGLGAHVSGWGDVRQHMRRKGLDFRDHMTAAEASDRMDRIADAKRAQR